MTDPLSPKPFVPPIPANERERLAALHRYKILNTPPEAAFDRITKLAARLFKMPIVLISLVDESRAWFKSCVGFDASEVPREDSLCRFALLTDEPLIIPDTHLDDRLDCNPFAQAEPGVRFYAGAPLLSHDGFNLGTLCLLDNQPHDSFIAEQQATLVDLAAMVVDELELRLSVQKIAQSKEKYRMLFESIDEGFCICEMLFDQNGKPYDYRFLEVNPVFAKLTGLEAAAGKTARQLVPDLENHWVEIYGSVVETGESVRFEQQSIAINRWFNVNAFCINEPQSRQFALLFTEISDRICAEAERKQAENQLRDSEEMFRNLADHAPFMVWVTDSSGCCTYLSQSWYSFTGQTPESGLGFGWLNRTHPQDRAATEQLFRDATRRQEAFRLEYRLQRQDGEYIWAIDAASPWFGVDGQFKGYIGSVIDISDRKQAEAALQESEAQSRNILESITDAFFALDEQWRVTYLNRTAETLLDRTPGDLIGQNVWDVYPGLAGSEFEQLYWQVMRDRVAGSVTSFYPDHDRWYESHVYPAAKGITIYFRNVTEQIQTAAILRQSEERYRTLFESIDEGFCVVEVLLDDHDTPIDYRILEVNPIFEQQAGLQQAVGKTARQLNFEEHWIEIYGRVALTGESIRFENGAETLNRWFDVYACRIGEPDARKVAIVFKDITERKRHEANLAFLADIAEDCSRLASADEIMQTVGAKIGAYLQVTTCNFTDVDEVRGEVTVHHSWNSPEVPSTIGTFRITDYLSQEFERASRAGEKFVICDTYTDPRTDKPALVTPNIHSFVTVPFHRDGKWAHYLAICDSRPRDWRDDELELIEELSNRIFPRLERARAEALVAANLQDTQRLRELGARLVTEADIQTLYQEILSAALTLTHADAGTVQILDEATQELVLFAIQGFEQNMTDRFYRVNVSSNTSCGIAFRSGTRTFVNFDVPEHEDLDGSMRMHLEAGYLSAQSTPLITRSGKTIGMVSTYWHQHYKPSDRELQFLDLLARQVSDLIEQRQTAAEREQLLASEQAARAEADRANRIKDEFLAVLSHELRSPLNPILGWTRLLQNGKLDPARQIEALKTIERNAKLQTQLIEDLLDISRIMQGKLSLTVAPVSLAFVITAAVETVRLAAEAKHIAIMLDLGKIGSPVSGDAARLQQVVWNLLTNAVKFTPNGGQVTVELRQLAQLAQIRVIDTGKGIHSKFLPHVFEYFRQEDGSTTRKFGGLGLGLAIVRQIVEMHGGTVWAESMGENQGATFVVQLPIIEQIIPPIPELAQTQAETAETPLSNLQILVVDDDDDTREFQAFVLEQSGAKVTAVTCGFEALQSLDQFIPDVIVSDVGMAEMDGYMLIQQIRLRPHDRGGKIPAIAATAYARDFDQQKALQSGFQAHIVKPIEPDALIKTITNLLNPSQFRNKF